MARITSRLKAASTTLSTPGASDSVALSSNPSATYLRRYRAARKVDPLSRLRKKIRMLTKQQLLDLERTVNGMLGPKKLPDPMNPWKNPR